MPQNNEHLLIDYLDNNLTAEEAEQVKAGIGNDKKIATEWEYLKMAVGAIELGAIHEKVASARQSFEGKAANTGKASAAIVRNMYRTGLRVAAILILLMGVSIVYKYSSVNNSSVYHAYFTEYSLNTTRGAANADAIEEAYLNRNWKEVITVFDKEATKSNKSYFLAGMAALELQQYPEAVTHFENILAVNEKSGDKYFQDEAEYYLALAFLMNKQADKGVSLLNKIRENKNHLYYPLASQIPYTDLKIIDLKNNK